MKSIEQYIKDSIDRMTIDSHVNRFGRNGMVDYPRDGATIDFVENLLKYKDEPLLPYFEDYFKNHTEGRNVVACVGKDVDETLAIYERYKDKFRFFGEIKCYKHYRDSEGKEHEYFDDSIIKGVLHKGLPVFIHWDLNGRHNEELADLLHENPDTKFILCHCGLNEIDNKDEAYATAVKMQTKHPNLWLEISWLALDYVCSDNRLLPMIEVLDHTVVGTDWSSEMKKEGFDFNKVYSLFHKIHNQMNNEQALDLICGEKMMG